LSIGRSPRTCLFFHFPDIDTLKFIEIGAMKTPDWDAHRAEIERLYIAEKRTLDDIIGILEATHGFVARSVI